MSQRLACFLPAIFAALFLTSPTAGGANAEDGDTVSTANGVLEGTIDPATGIRMFKGVPFAHPPVGDLRWKEPQR